MTNKTAHSNRRHNRRTTPIHLVLTFVALALLASSCGGSSDDTQASGNGDPTASGGVGSSDPGDVSLDDLDIDIPDIDLEDLDGDGQNDEQQAAESPYTGFRMWSSNRVEEILPGGPENLAPNPFDEFAFEGPTFALDLQPYSAGGDRYVSTLVASYDWAWVIAGRDGEQLARLDYPSNSVDVTIDTETLHPGGWAVVMVGDDDAIYVGIDHADDKIVVELDPATGEERGRVSLPAPPSPLLLMDVNDSHVAVGYRDGATTTVVIDRASFEIAYEVPDPDGDTKTPLLTDDELLIVHSSGSTSEGDTMTHHSLTDGAETSVTELNGNATTRAFGNTVVQYDANAQDPEMYGVAGDGQTIVDALMAAAALHPDEGGPRAIDDAYIGDGFAIVHSCCIDVELASNQSIFVIDLGSGEIVLTSKANGKIVPPPS